MEVLAYFVLYFVLTSSRREKAVWRVIPYTRRVPQVYVRKFPSLAKRVKKKQTPLGRRRVSSWATSLFFPEFKRSFQETVPSGVSLSWELPKLFLTFSCVYYVHCVSIFRALSVQFLRDFCKQDREVSGEILFFFFMSAFQHSIFPN